MTELITKPADSRPVSRKKSQRKVKTGCRTCKVRKVKCDEGRPACRACISTGRVCDGYGIWGGGGNHYGQRRSLGTAAESLQATERHHSVKLLAQRSPFPPLIPVSNTEEHLHFQFFKEQTLAKLPGVYSSKYRNLWETLVVQACAEEPAVMHAVLAISSAHRRKVLDGASRNKVLVLPDKQEEFLLRNYCKSIKYLQPSFQNRGTRSLRTTLLTCLVYIYLELLRGTYKRAYDHLDGGMRLLADLHDETSKKGNPLKASARNSSLSLDQDCIDAFLTEAFARLRVQMEFSGLRSGTGSTLAPKEAPDLPTLKFESSNEARHYLDRVFDGINTLSQAIRDRSYARWPDGYWNIILTERRFMQGSLASWMRSCTATMADLAGTKNDDELTEYRMLRIYHTMAEILGATCLSPEQAVFDHHSSSFLSIVTQCHDIALSVEPSKHACISSRLPGARRRAWPDISWIPPLYYTAIKCRDHQIRTRAVDLMSSFWPYEIVWDLGILNVSSIVAKEVIRMEEADFITPAVKVQESEDNIMPKNILEHDLVPSRLSLPEERRFDTVEMVLLNDVPRSIQMVCRKWLQGRERVIRKIYNEAEDTWIKVEEEPTSRSNVRGSAAYSTKGIANRI